MTTTTPDMNLVLPDVSVTAGPQWATLLNAAFTAVDSHDHSTGKGMKVTPSGLNISSDLSFVQNNATDLRSLRLYPNSVFTAGVNDKTCVYSLNGDLYYIDNTGVSIRITNNGTVDVNGAIQTLSIKDTGLFIQYFGDTTRQFRFDASAIPASTARVISMPESGGNDTLVTLAATQTIINKTLTTPVLNNPVIANYANLSNSSVPATPGAGSSNLYVSNVDNQLHLVSSAGVDTAIGASSSSGKNYLQTYYGFALNPVTNAATSLTVTGNRTTSQGFFGTSSAVASTLLAYNTSTPLRAPGDLQFIIPSASSGVFIESPMFTLDSIDVNAGAEFISFEMNAATSGAAAGDALLSVIQYDSSGNYVSTIQPSITQLPSGYFKFKAAFNPTSTASSKYAIRFTANTASARTIDIQNIIVGPQYAVAADAVGGWIAYTPTFSAGFGTATNVSVLYRRVGDSMEIQGTFTTGTVSSALASISLPSGLTLDSSKLSANNTTSGSGAVIGVWAGSVASQTNLGMMVTAPATATNVIYFSAQGLSAVSHNTPVTTNTNFNSGDIGSFRALVPIAQWSATITLAGNPNIEYASNSSSTNADDTTSFANGAGGSIGVIGVTNLTTARLKRVRFSTSIQPTDRIQIEIFDPTSNVWLPVQSALVNLVTGRYASLSAFSGYGNATDDASGMGFKAVAGSTTDIDVIFNKYLSYTTSSLSFSQWNNGTTTAGVKWRVAKYSAVGLAELAPATATSQGSISRENVWTPYTPTISAGFGTVTNNSAFYKVLGDSLFIRGSFTTGSVAASVGSISIPSQFTISSSKLSLNNTSSSSGCLIGGFASNSGTGAQAGTVVTATATSTSVVYIGNQYANSNNLIPGNVSAVISGAQPTSYQFEVPLV